MLFRSGTFRPNDPMSIAGFEKLVALASGKEIKIISTDRYIHRDTALTVLYKAFISNKEPQSLEGSDFTDINNTNKRAYIDAAYHLGLITGSDGKFHPHANLSRAHSLLLIDRFENFDR